MVSKEVKDMVREAGEEIFPLDHVYGEDIVIGEDYRLENGDRITIKSGQYWGEHGISNFWYWYNHDKQKEEKGYGGFYKLEEDINMSPYSVVGFNFDGVNVTVRVRNDSLGEERDVTVSAETFWSMTEPAQDNE